MSLWGLKIPSYSRLQVLIQFRAPTIDHSRGITAPPLPICSLRFVIFFLSFIVRIISLISMAFWGYFTVVSTQLMIISELCCSISYRRSNTFSLKTYPFIDLLFLWTLRELYSVKEPCHMRMHFVCRLNWRQISLQLKSLSLSFWYSDSFFQLKLQICNCIIIINSPSSFWKKKWLIYLDSENRMYYLANLP